MIGSIGTLANIPEGVTYGGITVLVTSFLANRQDPTSPNQDAPDSLPLDGYVTITPTVGEMAWPRLPRPQISAMAELKCPVWGGEAYPPGVTEEEARDLSPGVVVTATDQPDAQPNRVQYKVTWQLNGVRVQPQSKTIDVPAGGVVDLATVDPQTAAPGTVIVTTTETADRAERAAERAETASAGVTAESRSVEWGGAVSLPAGQGFLDVTLVGNATLALPARGEVAEIVNVVVRQDSTGGRALAVPDALVAFKAPLVLSASAGAVDFLSLLWTGVEWLLLPGAMSMGTPT